MGHTYRGGKSGCKMVTLVDSYSFDGVSAGIWVIHTSPGWLQLVFHFGTENRADQLKKAPCTYVSVPLGVLISSIPSQNYWP